MLAISFLWPKNKIKKLIHLFNKKRFVLQQIILCSFVVSVMLFSAIVRLN